MSGFTKCSQRYSLHGAGVGATRQTNTTGPPDGDPFSAIPYA